MKVTIANKTLSITNQAGQKNSWNLTYGTYFVDPVFNYISVKDISDTEVQLRPELISEYNGTVGNPTLAQVEADLATNTRA